MRFLMAVLSSLQSSFIELMTLRAWTRKETIMALVRMKYEQLITISCLKLFHVSEYRSAIFTHTPDQAITAREVTAAVQAKHFEGKGKKIVTQIKEAGEWYDAENDHQEYLFKNPGGYQCATHRLWW
jgi:hypothetical protein